MEIAARRAGTPAVDGVHTDGDRVIRSRDDRIRRVGVPALQPSARSALPFSAHLPAHTYPHAHVQTDTHTHTDDHKNSEETSPTLTRPSECESLLCGSVVHNVSLGYSKYLCA